MKSPRPTQGGHALGLSWPRCRLDPAFGRIPITDHGFNRQLLPFAPNQKSDFLTDRHHADQVDQMIIVANWNCLNLQDYVVGSQTCPGGGRLRHNGVDLRTLGPRQSKGDGPGRFKLLIQFEAQIAM